MKKIVLCGSVVAIILFLFAGCSQGPGVKVPLEIRGVVVNPEGTCYLDFEPNPAISEGLPLPNATVTIIGDQGSRVTTTTDGQGVFSFWGYAGEAYVLYAAKDAIRVKRGVAPLTVSQDVGEANSFTTAQVIIWEVANELYPGALAIKDIPTIDPGEELPEKVRAALAECQDAQKDAEVRAFAERIVNVLFGAPGVVDVPEGDTTPSETPTPTPGETPTPTPTVPSPPPCPGCSGCPTCPSPLVPPFSPCPGCPR
ncbi:MAG: carboxypeptidase-like regulatory domain-containing protein [Candidatus Caldatribacterium sp.]|uniref:hypothetical protein n=1 Tax=Candidatus Caldatribacterium sp. TaxID=2282143 RepID=UPI0029918A09|nr:carboxypeptidase-like regulatory domain-containing protein [Candidatus Caldatribacterium sp.]MCX7729793.1 carboxypeptidase-like regulatory domain-containing protein [Candidatus Caldatribacterium sp.]MDW8081557.1 carboxypeptidase-like regulatory domain-containing protein [Candidatus Calescibacterium sp.]